MFIVSTGMSQKNENDGNSCITRNRNIMTEVYSVRYLGVTVDRHFHFGRTAQSRTYGIPQINRPEVSLTLQQGVGLGHDFIEP